MSNQGNIMKAFINTPITKERFIHHLKWHQKQDAFLKGTYWNKDNDNFKGCAVGCSIHSIGKELGIKTLDYEDHSLYEKYLGVPEWLARVEDILFEGLPNDRSKLWTVEFGEAINVGSDLDKIRPAFLVFMLESTLQHIQTEEFKQQKESVEKVISLWKRSDLYSVEWEKERAAARSAAESAARSDAWSAAWSAAESARSAAESARSATESAAESARSAAESAGSAAESAAESAGSAAESAAESAWSAEYIKFADKLLELMRNEK